MRSGKEWPRINHCMKINKFCFSRIRIYKLLSIHIYGASDYLHIELYNRTYVIYTHIRHSIEKSIHIIRFCVRASSIFICLLHSIGEAIANLQITIGGKMKELQFWCTICSFESLVMNWTIWVCLMCSICVFVIVTVLAAQMGNTNCVFVSIISNSQTIIFF